MFVCYGRGRLVNCPIVSVFSSPYERVVVGIVGGDGRIGGPGGVCFGAQSTLVLYSIKGFLKRNRGS